MNEKSHPNGFIHWFLLIHLNYLSKKYNDYHTYLPFHSWINLCCVAHSSTNNFFNYSITNNRDINKEYFWCDAIEKKSCNSQNIFIIHAVHKPN